MNRARVTGFTLIELLVALTISGMLLALVSQAFYLITRQWETRFSEQEAALDLAGREFLVVRALEAMLPFVSPEPVANQQRAPLLNGYERSLEWVTAAPVWHQPPALATLAVSSAVTSAVTTVQGDTAAHWVYRERPIDAVFGGGSSTSSGSEEESARARGQSLVLWQDSGERFEYFGYLSLTARLGGTSLATGGAERSDRYTGAETGQVPMAVRLSNDRGDVISVDIPTNSLRYLQGTDY